MKMMMSRVCCLSAILGILAFNQVLAFTYVQPFLARAFATSSSSSSSSSTSTQLNMGLFDFKPFRGSGDAKEEELDEIWRTQQEILKARRAGMAPNKDELKGKYTAEAVKAAAAKAAEAKAALNAPPVRPKSSTSSSSSSSASMKKPIVDEDDDGDAGTTSGLVIIPTNEDAPKKKFPWGF